MSALFRARTWRQIAVILVAIAGIAADRPPSAFSIPAVFQQESFRPTLPTERALVKRYGNGVLERRLRQAYRIYKDRKSGLWVSCRIDENDRVNRPITAIVLSGVNLSDNSSAPDIVLPHLQLHGLQVGNAVPAIVEKCGQPRRIYERNLTDRLSFRTYEYFLKDKDSCVRFYVKNNRIVAASISSEE